MAQSLQLSHKVSKAEESVGADRRSRPLKKPPALSADETGAAEKAKKRSAWADPNLTKNKISSPLLTPESTLDDPFAGMSSSVNYQQEIERLKALVPKVDVKKRSPPRPKSAGFDVATPPGNNKSKTRSQIIPTTTTTTTTQTRKGATSPRPRPASALCLSSETIASRETTPFSASYSASRVTSPLSTPRSGSPIQSDYMSSTNTTTTTNTTTNTNTNTNTITAVPEDRVLQLDAKGQSTDSKANSSVITEEEKARFLEFMRSWTGGWNSWERSDADDHGIASVQSGGSLWAEQLPWTTNSTNRRLSWRDTRQHSLSITLPERNTRLDLAMRSEPCTPMLAPR